MTQIVSRFKVREAVLFVIGTVTFGHEVFYAETERPFLIAASLALMGLPFVLAGEERLRRNGRNGNGDRSGK